MIEMICCCCSRSPIFLSFSVSSSYLGCWRRWHLEPLTPIPEQSWPISGKKKGKKNEEVQDALVVDTELDDSLAITRLFFVIVLYCCCSWCSRGHDVPSTRDYRRERVRVTKKAWVLGLSDNNKSNPSKKVVWFTKEKTGYWPGDQLAAVWVRELRCD